MKHSGLAVGLAACCLLAAPAVGTAKEKKTAEARTGVSVQEAEKEKRAKITSPFSWETEGRLRADLPLKGCRVVRTEQEWLLVSRMVGAEGFPVTFSEHMLLLCALPEDRVTAVHFTKAEPGKERLEAVMSLESADPKKATQAAATPALLLFHLIEVPKYDGPVRISFEDQNRQPLSAFPPMDLSAASAPAP